MKGLHGELNGQDTAQLAESLPAECLYGELARLLIQAGDETVDFPEHAKKTNVVSHGSVLVARLACRLCDAGCVLTLENQKLGALYDPPDGKSYLDCNLLD